jgi:carboxymethylenebutenolidase
MMGSNISIPGPDGAFSGYLAKPKSGTGPGVVVIQEIFGINAVMRGIADDLAAQGYVALAPDLFWRIEPGIQLTDQSEAEWKRAFELYQAFNVDNGVKDIQATINHLRALPGVTGKIGNVGYCLGGLLSYLSATRTDTDASVSYYGVGIEGKLAESSQIKKPTLLHIAEKDQFVPPPAQAQILDGLKGKPGVQAHVYPGVDHAFARIGGQHYDKTAATLANTRTADFFKTHLH